MGLYEAYEKLTKTGEALVKERIKGTRKGLPEEANYLHSIRVRDMVSSCHHWDDGDIDLFLAALLHDVIEDGGVTAEELESMGFSKRTVELVQLCTHDKSIEDKTARWILMVAKLIEADDDDAWRIKLADLADNLAQSKGLTLDNRRFMIETKAPILLRLGRVPYSAWSKLNDETAKQRIEFAKQHRYVVTKWNEDFDIDGVMHRFAVLGEFEDRGEAMACAVSEMEGAIRNEMDVKTDWSPVERDENSRPPFQPPNKFNKVVFSKRAERRDTTGYNSVHVFIDVIEIVYETVVREQLFSARDGGWEVHHFFDKQNEEEKKDNFQLKRSVMKPTQCHLWKKAELVDDDLDDAFDAIKTYSEESHHSRRLVRCKQCGQLYLKEFFEEIDWIDGDDPQYVTYIPVRDEQEAESINKVGVWEFQTFSPRMNRDYPKGKPKKTYWIGRD